MPSPRSVLIDLETHGLDPSVAHHKLAHGGNLAPTHVEAPAPVVAAPAKAVKPGLVKLKEEKSESDDDALLEQMLADEAAQVSDSDEQSDKKAAKKAKKSS